MRLRSFLHPPSERQCFGANLGTTERDRPGYMRRLMSGLARQLSVPYEWINAVTPGRETWENPDIPSGYAYFAQLVAHDCVFTSVPTGALAASLGPTKSRRSSLLRLETIYGEGPDSSPHAFGPRGASHLARNRLALSDVSPRSTVKGDYVFRDVARTTASNSTTGATGGLASTQLADPRNDVHAAISQMTTLFILLHNRIASHIDDVLAREKFASTEVRNYRVYFVSRSACENIYRSIVRNDLLPRILHPAIVDAYSGRKIEFLDPQTLEALPLEFANAFRFGHAMVRPSYVFNDFNSYGEDLVDMMLSTSAARPWRMPLDETWMAQWSHFFEMNGSKPNLSRRIGPQLSGGLFSGEVFGAIDQTGSVGLGYRDLLNGAFVAMWSVTALADELRRRRPHLAGFSPLLLDHQLRASRIRAWLGRHQIASGLRAEDIEHLAADPPLFLYVLFEAAHDMDGRRLGVLGSIILAETLYRALHDVASPSGAPTDQPEGLLEDVCEIALGSRDKAASIKPCIPEINSMAEMITFVARQFEVGAGTMPFI